MAENLTLHVTGMTCGGCENTVKLTLGQVGRIEAVTASRKDSRVNVTYDGRRVTPEKITHAIEDLGYRVAALG